MGATVAVLAVQGIMAASPLGARRTMAGLPRWKVLTAALAASWVCVLGCLLIAFALVNIFHAEGTYLKELVLLVE